MTRDALKLSQLNSKKKIHEYIESCKTIFDRGADRLSSVDILDTIADLIERNPLNTDALNFRGLVFSHMGQLERFGHFVVRCLSSVGLSQISQFSQ